jgi:hypothetical protein
MASGFVFRAAVYCGQNCTAEEDAVGLLIWFRQLLWVQERDVVSVEREGEGDAGDAILSRTILDEGEAEAEAEAERDANPNAAFAFAPNCVDGGNGDGVR